MLLSADVTTTHLLIVLTAWTMAFSDVVFCGCIKFNMNPAISRTTIFIIFRVIDCFSNKRPDKNTIYIPD